MLAATLPVGEAEYRPTHGARRNKRCPVGSAQPRAHSKISGAYRVNDNPASPGVFSAPYEERPGHFPRRFPPDLKLDKCPGRGCAPGAPGPVLFCPGANRAFPQVAMRTRATQNGTSRDLIHSSEHRLVQQTVSPAARFSAGVLRSILCASMMVVIPTKI